MFLLQNQTRLRGPTLAECVAMPDENGGVDSNDDEERLKHLHLYDHLVSEPSSDVNYRVMTSSEVRLSFE